MEDEITDFNFSLQFVISKDSMYPLVYISGNSRPKPEYVVEMLQKLNTGAYCQNIYTCLKNYAEQVPDCADYIDNILNMWTESIKQLVKDAELNSKPQVDDEDELVVRPTQFIKFEGFPGDE